MSVHRMGLGVGLLAGLVLVGPATGQGFNMDLTLDQVQLGPTIGSTNLSADDLKGRVVLLEFWGIN